MSFEVGDFVIEEIISAKIINKDGNETYITHWFNEDFQKHDCCYICSRPNGCNAPNSNIGLCSRFKRI